MESDSSAAAAAAESSSALAKAAVVEGGEEEVQSSSSVGDNKVAADAEYNLVIDLDDKINNTKDPEPIKGKGLKKWRRIRRRDFGSPGGSGGGNVNVLDHDRILKRQGSAASTAAAPPLPRFNHHADSDNSEDLSSRSSTAASAPKFRSHRGSRAVAPPPGGRRVPQMATTARAEKAEPAKKHRGGIERDASYSSSMESDLRSSNHFFAEISHSGNGRHVSSDQDNCSEAQASDQQSNEFMFRESGPWEEEVSQSAAGNGTWEQGSCDRQSSRTLDPFTESILALQAVHDALEKEIQNFGEIGMEPVGLTGDSLSGSILNPEFCSVSEAQEGNTPGHGPTEEEMENGSLPLESVLTKINHKVYTLENKLEETMSMLEAKESRIVELESGVQSSWNCREIEAELEDLFRHKIEAEVEYLTMRKISQKLKLASEDQIALFEEQKTLINEQTKILNSFRGTEKNNVQTQKHNLGSSVETVQAEEVMKMQTRLCKYSCCFTIQLMLLFLLGLLLFPLWPGPAEFAPT